MLLLLVVRLRRLLLREGLRVRLRLRLRLRLGLRVRLLLREGLLLRRLLMSERLCDVDEGWLLVGDAAFFVDPLFSTGVSFAAAQAVTAARLIEAGDCDVALAGAASRFKDRMGDLLPDSFSAAAVPIREQVLGVDHPDTAQALHNLGNAM